LNFFEKNPILTASIVIFIAALSFFLFQPPRNECEIEINSFKVATEDAIYFQKGKSQKFSPRLKGAIENCRLVNNAGACLDAFDMLQRVSQKAYLVSEPCYPFLAEEASLKGVLESGISLLAQLGWGEFPPETGSVLGQDSWLEMSDLALFCQLKSTFIKIFGNENWQSLKYSIVKKLPGEKAVFNEKAECLNCENIKSALEVFGAKDAAKKSLLNLNCDRFK